MISCAPQDPASRRLQPPHQFAVRLPVLSLEDRSRTFDSNRQACQGLEAHRCRTELGTLAKGRTVPPSEGAGSLASIASGKGSSGSDYRSRTQAFANQSQLNRLPPMFPQAESRLPFSSSLHQTNCLRDRSARQHLDSLALPMAIRWPHPSEPRRAFSRSPECAKLLLDTQPVQLLLGRPFPLDQRRSQLHTMVTVVT